MDDFFEQFLRDRGMHETLARELFLSPDYERDTHDPFLLLGMERAIERFMQAFRAQERIAIYADFDADGIPGAVVLHDFFKKIGYENFEVYIPHRDTEGFGFHAHAVEALHKKGVALIVTVDVGITGIEAVRTARALGIDVIITDHHVPPAVLPEAYAIINPKQKECPYPYKDLCGAGVAFKVAHALALRLRIMSDAPESILVPKLGWEKWLLDMVALATIADMVPLSGENRVFVKFGLLVMRRGRRLGLRALLESARVRLGTLSEDDVAFFVAPRINAASRMDSPDKAFLLLTAQTETQASLFARMLEKLNRERKTAVGKITKEARARVEHTTSIIVLGNPDWKPAFLGLAAQSLMQSHKQTVCLWGREANGTYKGSCRGHSGMSLPDLFASLGDTLLQYGGHEAAGGFSFSEDRVFTLGEDFARAVATLPSRESIPKANESTYSVPLSFVNMRLIKMLEAGAPFGLANEKPLFEVEARASRVRRFGKGDAHAECTLISDDATLRAIAFFFEETLPREGEIYRVRGTCEQDTYRGGVVFRMHAFSSLAQG